MHPDWYSSLKTGRGAGCLNPKLEENQRRRFHQPRKAHGGCTVLRDRTRAKLILSRRRLSSFAPPSATPEQRHQPDFKRRAIFVVTIIAAVLIAIAAIWEARVILLVLFAGCLGALVLATLTSLLQSCLRIPRMVAFAAVLATLGLAAALGVWLRGPALAQQFGQLQVAVPDAAGRLYSSLGKSTWGQWILSNAPDDGQWSSWLSYAASGIKGAVSMIVSSLVCLLLVVMASIYLAAEPEFYLRGMQRILPSSIWPKVEACLSGAVRTLRFWLLSRLISMTAIGVIVSAGLWLVGIPLAGTLGIIAALLTFIPNIGPLASALPATLLAFAISPLKGSLTIGVFCLAHFIEGNFVTPVADRKIVKLPPFLTLSVQLLLAPVAGALGFAMAAPLLAASLGVVRVLIPAENKSASRMKIGQTI
jgi:predicted PurR-regulated permease PerM